MTKVPWGRKTMAGLAGAIGSLPAGMATVVLAGTTRWRACTPRSPDLSPADLESTTVMVVATTWQRQ